MIKGRAIVALLTVIVLLGKWRARVVSETRRKYVPVGLGPASLRATVSETTLAIHSPGRVIQVYGTAVSRTPILKTDAGVKYLSIESDRTILRLPKYNT